MPFFEVKVLAQAVVLVEAADEDSANLLAFEEADFSKAGHKEVQSAKLLTAAEDVDRSRRHCDQELSV